MGSRARSRRSCDDGRRRGGRRRRRIRSIERRAETRPSSRRTRKRGGEWVMMTSWRGRGRCRARVGVMATTNARGDDDGGETETSISLDSTTDDRRSTGYFDATGLEGFPARAAELLKLGFASFLGFGPFIAAISVVFCLTYFLFGSDFIHSGEGYGSPDYIPPEVLLAEPTVDRMIPFDAGAAARY